ncbi:GNAT family N-acetyltransferase [Marichromatium purpuratum]|uniref:GNAT family N-acetyltransferase n=1 Tax=Marichromatium purpuratum TaxID=37487 RepID=UPI00021E674E|nr:GNAT family N-acetyltransferase [Marichromatium purpuratum]
MEARELSDRGPGPHLVRLRDGSRCLLRALGPEDRDFLLACFAGLSPGSRRLRFCGVKRELNERDLAVLAAIDGHHHLAIGAIRLDERGMPGEPLGVARCIRTAPGADSGELAVEVIDAAQRRGVGTALLQALIGHARAVGIQRLRCEVLAANVGMRALAARLGGRPRWRGGAVLEYEHLLGGIEQGEIPCSGWRATVARYRVWMQPRPRSFGARRSRVLARRAAQSARRNRLQSKAGPGSVLRPGAMSACPTTRSGVIPG